MHSPTLLIMATLLMGIISLVMGAMWLYNRHIPGLKSWACSFVAGFLLCAVMLMRMLDETSAAMPLMLLLLQTLMFMIGCLTFVGARTHVGAAPPGYALPLALYGILLCATLYFSAIIDNPNARFLVPSLINALFFLGSAHALGRFGFRNYPGRTFLAVVMGVHALFLIARPFVFPLGGTGMFSANNQFNMSQFVLLESTLALTLIAFGILMVTTEYTTSKWRRLAERDPLTSVFNRRSFLTLLDKALSRNERQQQPLAVMLIDLDHFKSINDRWGHKQGDEALRHFVDIVTHCLRHEDILGRLGGEEFAVFLNDADLQVARTVAERLRSTVESCPVPTASGTIPLTISLGLTLACPGETPESVLHRADVAMYQAKHRGRNRIEIVAQAEQPIPALNAA